MDSCPAWHDAAMLEAAPAIAGSDGVSALSTLHAGDRGVIVGYANSLPVTIGDVAGSTVTRRLLELGFVPGEAIEVIGEVRPGGDPIAVRVGGSIFALRRREAAAVLIEIEPPTGGARR